MVGTIKELVVEVAGQIVGLWEVGLELGGAAADIGLEQVGGDDRRLEHFGDEGEELSGKASEEVERDVAGTDVGHAFDNNAVEVEELGHLVGGALCGGFAEELAGGMCLAFVALIGTAGLKCDVELDESDGVVAESIEGVAVG